MWSRDFTSLPPFLPPYVLSSSSSSLFPNIIQNKKFTVIHIIAPLFIPEHMAVMKYRGLWKICLWACTTVAKKYGRRGIWNYWVLSSFFQTSKPEGYISLAFLSFCSFFLSGRGIANGPKYPRFGRLESTRRSVWNAWWNACFVTWTVSKRKCDNAMKFIRNGHEMHGKMYEENFEWK